MPAKQPPEIARAAVASGAKKAHLSWDRTLVGSFPAGAYIAFGGLVAITVSAPRSGARCRPCSPAPSSHSAWSSC